MNKKLTAICQGLGLALVLPYSLLVSCPVQASDDPLDLPALMSARAAHAMLLGVAQAGTRLVAVGEHGVILYSDNHGKNWVQARVPVSVTLTAVQFPDARHGWAVGHDGVVLNSTDSGQSWIKRFDGNQANALMLADLQKSADDAHRATDAAKDVAKKADLIAQNAADNAVADVQAGAKFGPSRPLLGVYFDSANEGFVVGAYGQIFHTNDGGANWKSLAGRMHNPEGLHYNAISAIGTDIVIAGEGGKVYRSRDKGLNWQTLDTGYNGQLYGVLGLKDAGGDALLAYGFGGHIVLGSGDSAGWHELPAVSSKNIVSGAQMTDGRVLLATQDGSLLHSEDHGQHFAKLQLGVGMEIAGAALLDNGAAIALSGVGGVHIVATNAGKVQ